MGQEIFNAIIILSASFLIAITVIWMKKHGKEIVGKLKQTGEDVKKGDAPIYILTIITALTILREGSEIVLFSYGLMAKGETLVNILTGALLGSCLAIFVSGLAYFGVVKISTAKILNYTSYLLILLCAGMASIGVNYLVQGGIINFGTNIVWDSSSILSDSSILGEILSILIGYISRPSLIQVVVYVSVIILLSLAIYKPKKYRG